MNLWGPWLAFLLQFWGLPCPYPPEHECCCAAKAGFCRCPRAECGGEDCPSALFRRQEVGAMTRRGVVVTNAPVDGLDNLDAVHRKLAVPQGGRVVGSYASGTGRLGRCVAVEHPLLPEVAADGVLEVWGYEVWCDWLPKNAEAPPEYAPAKCVKGSSPWGLTAGREYLVRFFDDGKGYVSVWRNDRGAQCLHEKACGLDEGLFERPASLAAGAGQAVPAVGPADPCVTPSEMHAERVPQWAKARWAKDLSARVEVLQGAVGALQATSADIIRMLADAGRAVSVLAEALAGAPPPDKLVALVLKEMQRQSPGGPPAVAGVPVNEVTKGGGPSLQPPPAGYTYRECRHNAGWEHLLTKGEGYWVREVEGMPHNVNVWRFDRGAAAGVSHVGLLPGERRFGPPQFRMMPQAAGKRWYVVRVEGGTDVEPEGPAKNGFRCVGVEESPDCLWVTVEWDGYDKVGDYGGVPVIPHHEWLAQVKGVAEAAERANAAARA